MRDPVRHHRGNRERQHHDQAAGVGRSLTAGGIRILILRHMKNFGETNMKKSLVPAKPIEMPDEFRRFFDIPVMVRAIFFLITTEIDSIKDHEEEI
jgi:hypothetical protein